MNSAQSKGLSALSSSIEKEDQNARNMQYMQQLSDIKKQENQQKEVDQLKEQQYYDSLNKEADGLLAGDKAKIQKRAIDIQRSIKEQIKMYGGDRSKFLQNGGHRLLKGYADKITGSEEMSTFKSNKENLVKIMDMQEKGYGSRLMDRDLESLQSYQKTGTGKISYSGMMNEVEIPPLENYNLGQEIPIDDILSHGSNKMKILGNYKMYYPNLDNPTDGELKAFADKMGYGGKGSNRDNIDFARKLALTNAAKKESATARATKDTRGTNVVVNTANMMAQLPQEMTVADLYQNAEDGKQVNWYKDQKGNKMFENSLGSWDYTSKRQNLDMKSEGYSEYSPIGVLGKLWREAGNKMSNPEVKIAHSGQIFGPQTNIVAKKVLNQEVDENGYVNISPDSGFFDMAGLKTSGSNALDVDKYKGKYKVLGVTTAVKGQNEQGLDQLLIEMYDDGVYDGELTKEFGAGLKGSVKPTAVLAMQNEDGLMFYKEVPMGDPSFTTSLSTAMGEEAWMDDYNDAEQKLSEISRASRNITDKEQAVVLQKSKNDNDALDQNPAFRMEAEDFTNKENPDFNRSTLMRAFYSSMPIPASQAASKNIFKITLAGTGKEAEELFKNFDNNYSDQDMIEEWLKLANKDVSSGIKQTNQDLAERWSQELYNYNKLYN